MINLLITILMIITNDDQIQNNKLGTELNLANSRQIYRLGKVINILRFMYDRMWLLSYQSTSFTFIFIWNPNKMLHGYSNIMCPLCYHGCISKISMEIPKDELIQIIRLKCPTFKIFVKTLESWNIHKQK